MSARHDGIESTADEFRRELNAVLDQLHADAPEEEDRRAVVRSLSRSLASARTLLDRSAPHPAD